MNITTRKKAAIAILTFVFMCMVGAMAASVGWVFALLLWFGSMTITVLIVIAVCILNE